jgi:hypothetical protein
VRKGPVKKREVPRIHLEPVVPIPDDEIHEHGCCCTASRDQPTREVKIFPKECAGTGAARGRGYHHPKNHESESCAEWYCQAVDLHANDSPWTGRREQEQKCDDRPTQNGEP